MKAVIKICAPILAMAALGAQAQGWYLGASVGVMSNDVGGFDDATNAGLLAGYDFFTREALALSVEAEATTTVSDGDVKFGGAKGDWDIDTQAAYLAALLGNEHFYMKVRYGVLREDVSIDIAGLSADDSDTGGSWGAALGWKVTGNWAVQVDGTMVESDVNYWNLGLRYNFQ